jgi:D-alanyl-D-alanine carboxypeptidase
MFKRFLPLAALAALLSACGGGKSDAPPSVSASVISGGKLNQIDDYAAAQMASQHVPGLTLVVTRNGVPVLEKGYGMADVGSATPAKAQTVYRIGSVSKQFAASAVLLLAQDGKLSLDQRFAQYFPVAPAAWKDITIRQLLQHTAGLQRDFQQYLAPVYDPNHNYTPDEVVQLMGTIPMQTAPGTTQSYSNIGYYLIGLLIERVSGRPYADFMRERMFTPLGMDTAALLTAPPVAGQTASGYDWNGVAWVRADAILPGDDGAEGALRMSAQDLAKWDAALNTDRILSKASRDLLWTPARLNDGSSVQYGLGWVLDSINNLPYVWHNGQVGGFHSQLARHANEGWTVIVLCNLTDGRAEHIAAGVAERIDASLAWKTVNDPQPQIAALARGAADDILANSFHPERYTAEAAQHLGDGLFAAYATAAAGFGAIEQFGLVDSTLREGVMTYRYLVKSRNDSALLILQVDGGKISALGVQ